MSNEKVVNNSRDLRLRMTSSGLIAPSSQQQNPSAKIIDPTEPTETPTELDANLERIIELQARVSDLESLLEAIPNLEKTIAGLENRTENLENRKPTPGRPGPPGDITAALNNVERAAPRLVRNELKMLLPEILVEVEQSMPVLVDKTIERFKIKELRGERGPVGETGRDGQSIKGDPGRDAVTPTREMIENFVATFVSRALAESQLLDESGEYAGPLLKFAIEQAVEQALKMRVS